MDHLRSGVGDHPGQHGKTLCMLKHKKLAWCGGVHLLSQLLGRLRQGNRLDQEAEVAVSQDRTFVFQSEQKSKPLSQKKKKNGG